MRRVRLDQLLVEKGLVASRSQAESYIKLGKVKVAGREIMKPGYFVPEGADVSLSQDEQYVSRAALKLASAAEDLDLDFDGKIILDVGSSTGGFTDFALKHKAAKVIAVDVGTDQMHPSLRDNPKVELHEKTDIRNFSKDTPWNIDIVLIDVSFISLKQVLPAVAKLSEPGTHILAMVKPQFEAGEKQMHEGVIKNDSIRREILKDFENWAKDLFIIENKLDSKVAGARGNLERFYLLKTLRK